MAQKTIKLSELNTLRSDSSALKAVVADRDYWLDESWQWEQAAIKSSVQNGALKNKLWAAEQEIHDLKEEVEFAQDLANDAIEDVVNLQTELDLEQDDHDRATDEWEQVAKDQGKDIQKLTNQVIDLVATQFSPLGQIDPPACLKPKDAQTWTHTYVSNHSYLYPY